MKDLIQNFPNQLKEAIEIGRNAKLNEMPRSFQNVVISGLGGSGIGGNFAAEFTADEMTIPIISNKGYTIPNCVNEHTLFVACSYSGNTEETLNALELAMNTGCEIACITSGGKLLEIAKEKDYNYIEIPGGMPPRSCLGYSLVQQMFLFWHYELISDKFIIEFENAIKLMEAEQDNMKELGQDIAKKLVNNMPILYGADSYEATLVRWRQQINENGKMLCWHHVIPEMNHNELVGWRIEDNRLAVVILRNDDDFDRIKQRIELNKEIINAYTNNIIEIFSKGKTRIERSFYFVHLGDWISWYLSEERQVDATEVKVIDYLKGELAKMGW